MFEIRQHELRQYARAGLYLVSGLLALSLLSACGFKLRGSYELPHAMQATFVQVAHSSPLLQRIRQQLADSGVEVLKQPREDAATLRILTESRNRRVTSVDSQGRPREYTLIYQLSYEMYNARDEFRLPQSTLSVERDFIFDTEAVLGNQQGEEQLFSSMERDIVRLLMLQLQSAKSQEATP